MLEKSLELLLDYLKGRKYWNFLQPFVILTLCFVAVELIAYKYIQLQYGFRPDIWLFIGSYFFLRVSIVFLGIAVLIAIFFLPVQRDSEPAAGRVRNYLRRNRPILLIRTTAVLVVVSAIVSVFIYYGPSRVSTIRVKLMNEPTEYKPEVFAYIVFELNRRQRNWFFELDFTPFNPRALLSREKKDCENSRSPVLCYAITEAKGAPIIGITESELGDAYFSSHLKNASVISTADQAVYSPLTTYEYLAYSLVLQSILIHLDLHGGGLNPDAFAPGSASHGGIFQFNPRKEVLRATILSARLGPDEESLLMNRFGAEYMNTCRELLTLEWLHSARVTNNLKTYFNVSLKEKVE